MLKSLPSDGEEDGIFKEVGSSWGGALIDKDVILWQRSQRGPILYEIKKSETLHLYLRLPAFELTRNKFLLTT